MTSPISTEQNSYTSGLEGFRKELSHRGISDQTTRIITKSRRTGTQGNDESTWKRMTRIDRKLIYFNALLTML